MQIQCEHCGYTYVSRPEMAGKRVRCRNCGQVFVISAGIPDEMHAPDDGDFPEVPTEEVTSPFERKVDTTHAMPAITTTESNMTGGIGSAKSRMERTADAAAFEIAGERPAGFMRPSTPFSFPFAGELDLWLPRLITLLMLAWPAYLLFRWRPELGENQTYPTWAGLMPAVTALLLFFVVWLPFFAVSMRKVAGILRFSRPSRRLIRAACLASFPFGLGLAFWIAGEGAMSMAIGVFLGTAIAVPGAWFLYRLTEQDIGYSAVALAVGSLFATLISIMLYIGVNIAVNHTLASMDQASQFADSPLGPGLNWQLPPKPKTASRPPVRPHVPPSTAQSPSVPEAGRFVASAVPVEQQVTDVVHPLGGGNYMAIVSPSSTPESADIAQYSIEPTKQLESAVFASSRPEAGYALSPSGDLLARVTLFRGTMIQFWSFSQKRVISTVELGPDVRPPRLLGFLNDSSLLCEWRDGQYVLSAVDPVTLKWTPWVNSSDIHGEIVAVLPSLNLVATTVQPPAGKGKGARLRLYSPDGQHDIPLSGPNPNGLAGSPDGSKFAVAYEESGQLQIIVCRRSDSSIIANHIFPGGLRLSAVKPKEEGRRENRLIWLPGGNLLVYDRLIIDAAAGMVLGQISGVDRVAKLDLVAPDTIHLLKAEQSPPRLFQVKLRLPTTQPPATQPRTP